MVQQVVLSGAPGVVARALRSPERAVVAPNRRAGEAFGQPLARSLVELATRWLRPDWQVAPEVVANEALTAAVAAVLGPRHAARQAQVLGGALARLLRAGADLEQLRQVGSPRVRDLAAVGLGYRERLAERGLVAAAELLHRAAGRVGAPDALLVAGYARLDADDRAFLLAAAGAGSVVVLPGGPEPLFAENRATAEWFAARGWAIAEAPTPAAATVGERLAACFVAQQPATVEGVRRNLCASPEDEVRAALAEVQRLLLDGVAASQITVVARDEERYAPLVQKVAAEYGLPVRPQGQGPLAETHFGSYLLRLLALLVDDAPYELALATFADPLAGGLDDEPRATAQHRRAHGVAAWQQLLPGQPLLGCLADRAPRGLPAWLAWLEGLLAASELPQRLVAWPRELHAHERFREGLRLLADPGRELTAAQFVEQVNDLLRATTVALDVGRGGVPLHTPLALFGSRCDHLLVLGAAAGLLPPPLSEDPCLDTVERAAVSALGYPLETAAAQSQRERLSFWMLLQAAQRQLLFYQPLVVDRAPTMVSSYLDLLGLPSGPPALLLPPAEDRRYRLGAPVTAVEQAAAGAWAVECRRESPAAPDAWDGVLDEPVWPAGRSLAVSALITLGQCPFKWFARHALRLAPPDETAADPDALLLGTLYHGVLELAVRAALDDGQPTDRERLLSYLDPALAACLGEPADGSAVRQKLAAIWAQRPATGPADDDEQRQARFASWAHWPILRREVLQTLELAVRCPDFLPADAVPCEVEFGLAGESAGLRVHGRVDRADRLTTGAVRLLDYKSGSSRPAGIQDAAGKLNVDLQLPLYAALYEQARGEPAEVGYLLLRGRKLLRGQPQAVEKLALATEFVASVAERLASGRVPVQPDVDEAACRACDYAAVCRVGARVARKGVG
ncbi:MAG: PD-(D/E)XK nuclease family protein [Fimbriimonadaceae bacterium]|nr:PD-(D/E)XK nuclease family protein [Fimbriimonadaceae bacterium]